MTTTPSLPPEDRKESVSRLIHAPADRIFDLLADVRRHTELDGSSMLQGRAQGPQRLELGSEFSMGMKQGLPYRSRSRVVEFEEDRRITWRSGVPRGDGWLLGGQGWRWDLEPQGQDTLVTHTYLWGWAGVAPVLSLARFPARMRGGMGESLAHLAAAVEGDGAP